MQKTNESKKKKKNVFENVSSHPIVSEWHVVARAGNS